MKNKKILALMLTGVLMFGNVIPVLATPNSADSELKENQDKYSQIENKIADIESKIYDLNAKMEPLQVTINNNEKEVENIKNVIGSTTKEIEQAKEEITQLDAVLGERVKSMYTSGNIEFSYLNFLLDSQSTSDLFSRIQALANIVGKDKESIEDVISKKKEMNEKVESLESKKVEIDKLNEEVKENLSELDEKKKEQEVLSNEAKQEKTKFDSEHLSISERKVIKSDVDIINDSTKSSSEIEEAVGRLKNALDKQLKSEIVISEAKDAISKGNTNAANKKQAEQAAAQSSSSSVPNRGASNKVTPSLPSSGRVSALLSEAYKHLGKPYKWEATGPNSFDCSGFTQYVYSHALGIDISRTTYTQINQGTPVSQADLQPGDLVFPHTGHVGIYVGNGQMIHAPQTGDVIKIGPVYRFYAARRIL